MSQQKKNIELVRGAYEGFARGDIAAVLGLFTPDSVVEEAAGLPYAGTFRGAEGMQQLLGKILETFEAPEIRPLAFFHDEADTVAVHVRLTGRLRATGRAIDMGIVELWKLRDEKVVELRPFYWDTAALAA